MTESDVCENNEAEFREMKQKAQISHEIEMFCWLLLVKSL